MAALKSQGTGIYLSDGASPIVWTEIPDVQNIGGPSGSAAIIDATALDDTAKNKIMGLPDEGQVQMSLIWGGETGNATQVLVRAARAAQTLQEFQIRLTDSPRSTYTFNAYVTGWSLSTGVDDLTKADVTLEITAAVTAA